MVPAAMLAEPGGALLLPVAMVQESALMLRGRKPSRLPRFSNAAEWTQDPR